MTSRRPFEFLLVAITLISLGCGGSSSDGDVTSTEPQPPADENPLGLACIADGYPCSLSEVSADVLEENERIADEVLARLEAGDSTLEVIDWIQVNNDNVADVAGDDLAIIFRLDGGRPVWIFRERSLAHRVEQPEQSALPKSMIPHAVSAMVRASQAASGSMAFPPTGGSQAVAETTQPKVVGDSPTDKSALILSPFRHEFGEHDEGSSLQQILGATRGYEDNVRYKENETKTSQNITLEDYADWENYDVIHVSTHGNTYCNETGCSGVISTGIAYTTTEELLALLQTGVSQARIEGDDDVSYLAIGADFFRSEYPDGLTDTLIFFSACRTFGQFEGQENSSLADVLQGDSSMYLGWDGVTNAVASREAAEVFYQALSEDGVEVSTAYEELGPLRVSEGVYEGEQVVSNLILGLRPAGGDLRLREIASLRHPDTGQELEEGASIPLDGTASDGINDEIPFRILVDGVRAGASEQFTVHLSVDGSEVEPFGLADGNQVSERAWELAGMLDLGFDAMENQLIGLRAWVDLPDEGISEHAVSVRLTDREPLEIGFHSTMDFDWVGVGSTHGEVRATITLLPAEDPDTYFADAQPLEYVSYSQSIAGGGDCTIDAVLHDGTLAVPQALVSLAQTEVIVLPDGVAESISIQCGSSAPSSLETIHWLAGWISFHSGELMGAENEFDEETFGWRIGDWQAGSGDVIARRVYDRQAPGPEGGSTFTEHTTIEIRR